MQTGMLAYDPDSTSYKAGEWVGRILLIALVAWAIYFFLIKKRPPKIRSGSKVVTTREVHVVGLIHWPGEQPTTFEVTLPAGIRFTAPYPLMPRAPSFSVSPDIPATWRTLRLHRRIEGDMPPCH